MIFDINLVLFKNIPYEVLTTSFIIKQIPKSQKSKKASILQWGLFFDFLNSSNQLEEIRFKV